MKTVSKSKELAATVLHAAMCIVRDAGGSMQASQVVARVEPLAPKDEYSLAIIESNGLPRWKMNLQFFSIDAVKAGYLEKATGIWKVTPSGIIALKKSPIDFLEDAQAAYKEWKATQLHAKAQSNQDTARTINHDLDDEPPSETISSIIKNCNIGIAADLLALIKSNTPEFFEKLVLELLLKMGYGKFQRDAGKHSGQSGDAGIDGVINEDRLGLDAVYIQAKRWEGSVGRPDVQAFVGALQGQRAHKGVFITSSWFSPAALEYVKNIQNKVVLIDGERLAQLMIEYNLGVSTAITYELKKIDTDFFSEY